MSAPARRTGCLTWIVAGFVAIGTLIGAAAIWQSSMES